MVLGRWGLMTVIGMSRPEIDRVHILRDVVAERITVREAAQLLRITRRQVFRLLKAYHAGGPAALVSSRRGKPSNRSYPAALRSEVLALITANYADFGQWQPMCGRRHQSRLLVCGFQCVMLASPTSFFALSGLSGALCLSLALWKGERPFARSLTYWDEAAWFGLVACLG
jgi:hypothetical protein